MTIRDQNGRILHIDDHAEIHRGGEGRIMLLKELPNKVAKIYFDPKRVLLPAHLAALGALNPNRFVVPESLLFEDKKQGKAIGFIMPLLDHSYQPLSAFFGVSFCQKYGITFSHKLQWLDKLIEAVAEAHTLGLVIGDLSGLNILLNPATDDLKMIDTDAYQSPAQVHSGILLDEIRDHAAAGCVSVESDYFALSVVAFQLLTFVHPFKGVHATYQTLVERVIRKIPVFANTTALTLPKCYVPLQDPFLIQQFSAMFEQGHRSLLQLPSGNVRASTHTFAVPKTAPRSLLPSKGNMQIQTLWTPNMGEYLREWSSTTARLLLQTNIAYYWFDLSQKGYARLLLRLPADEYEHIWTGKQRLIGCKNNILYVIDPNTQNGQALQQISWSAQTRYVQYDNLLALVDDEHLRLLHLDEVNGGFIRTTQEKVWGHSFHASGGNWLQQVGGGGSQVLYRSGDVLSSVSSAANLRGVYVCQQFGIGTERVAVGNDTQQRYVYFGIKNMQLSLSNVSVEQPKRFACKPIDKNRALLFEPTDDALLVRRSEDFAVLQTIDCPIMRDDSWLTYTLSGIVVANADGCYLLNSGS